MRTIQFNDFVRQVKFFCKTLGFKPYNEPGVVTSKHAFMDQIMPYIILFDLILTLFTETAFVIFSFKNGDNFVEAITSLTYIGFGIVGGWKMITISLKKTQLSQLASELYNLFPKDLKAQKKMEIKEYLHQCTMTSVFYAALNMMLTWSYNLTPLIQWLIFGAEQNLPYFAAIPWNWHNHWSYYFLFISQVGAAYSCTAGQILTDLILFAFATQVIMHYDNIAREISAYEFHADKPKMTPFERTKQSEQDLLFLKDIVSYHKRVLSLSNLMNDVFGIPLLINLLTSSFVICFVGFEMSVGESDFQKMIKLTFFMSASLVQVFLICQYGQQLIDSSNNIAYAAFSHGWPNADISYKKMICLIIARAQKPAILKATTFVVVSRHTMAALMKISYNFFALLQTMYAE